MNDRKIENWQKRKILESKEHQYKASQEINSLVVKERNGKNIVLSDGTKLTEFLSCSYLGLDQDERVVKASMATISKCGVNFAVSRTRMRTESFVVLEELLNRMFCNSYTTLFTSLHLAHLGVLPLLSSGEMPSFPIKNKPIFILDKTVHASIQITRGILNQFGEVVLLDFRFLDKLQAQFRLAQENGLTPIAISDGIGSMGGACPVHDLFLLADTYNGYIYIDDAHGTSVYGEYGCGYVLEKLENQFHPRLILAASLSKGFGTNGGVIAVPTKEDELTVKRFTTTYIFGNPLPLAIVDASIASAKIHLSEELIQLRNQLRENLAFFDSQMEPVFNDTIENYQTKTPIRCIPVGDEFKAIQYSSNLKKCGFMLSAAMYPTVAKGRSILRVTISADHTKEQIFDLCEAIKSNFATSY